MALGHSISKIADDVVASKADVEGQAMSTDTPRKCQAHFGMGDMLCQHQCGATCVVANPSKVNLELASVTEERDRLKQSLERLLNAEQQRLLLTSEEQIRREILAEGRDPDEYLRAIDSSMKCTTEKAILEHDLKAAEQQLTTSREAAIEECAKVAETYLKGPCPSDTQELYLPKAIRALSASAAKEGKSD